jgi:hypothetical protein
LICFLKNTEADESTSERIALLLILYFSTAVLLRGGFSPFVFITY